MSDLNSLDLKGFVTKATVDIFDTMLSMKMEPLDQPATLEGHHIVGTVSFAGEVMGNIKIDVTQAFGRLMAAEMLGMEVDELDDQEDVHDVIGEVSNMVGGDLKSRLCDAGFTCELSIPSIASGSDFHMESFDWTRHESFAFRCQGHVSSVELYIRGI